MELEDLPESMNSQVLNFIRFLKYSNNKKEFDTVFVSGPSLSKDWNTLDEDQAWKDL